MQPLVNLSVVQAWEGWEAISRRLEANGFFAHAQYHLALQGACENAFWLENLNLCLDEMAKECLSSGHLEGYRGAFRHASGFYCSAFLDSLELEFGANCKFGNSRNGIHWTFVHPALQKFDDEFLKLPREEWLVFRNDIESIKEKEFDKKNLIYPCGRVSAQNLKFI